jgi:hypothetical protein
MLHRFEDGQAVEALSEEERLSDVPALEAEIAERRERPEKAPEGACGCGHMWLY